MPGEGRQSRAAFTRSPGAHSLGGVSERGGGHSGYRPRHLQGGAPALILNFSKVCNGSQARAASPPGSTVPEVHRHLSAVGPQPPSPGPALSRDTPLPGSRRRQRRGTARSGSPEELREAGSGRAGARFPEAAACL